MDALRKEYRLVVQERMQKELARDSQVGLYEEKPKKEGATTKDE